MYAPLALQEKQTDIDGLTATVKEKDTVIQSLKDQIQQRWHEIKGTYMYTQYCSIPTSCNVGCSH